MHSLNARSLFNCDPSAALLLEILLLKFDIGSSLKFATFESIYTDAHGRLNLLWGRFEGLLIELAVIWLDYWVGGQETEKQGKFTKSGV